MSDTPQTPYQILGEDGIRELTRVFYDLMDTLPEASGVRAMHAEDLSPMKEKLAEYLIGWMGGPPLYADKYGTVCMTAPHEPYHIGPEERDQWLLCMDKALAQTTALPFQNPGPIVNHGGTKIRLWQTGPLKEAGPLK